MAIEASLPKLLSLDKRNPAFDDQVEDAATIAGIDISSVTAPKLSIPRVKPSVSPIRAEFVLRWALEKLKTVEGRRASYGSKIFWNLLEALIDIVPATDIARLVQSSRYLENLACMLEDTVPQNENSTAPETASSTGSLQKPSKKRKRESDGSTMSSRRDHISREQQLDGIDHAVDFLSHIVAIASDRGTTDAVSREHVAAALRVAPEQAARILNGWLDYSRGAPPRARLLRHKSILHLWTNRSRGASDESENSAGVFSQYCLTSTILCHGSLKNFVSSVDDAESQAHEIEVTLEQLLARHCLLPAHRQFARAQASNKPSRDAKGELSFANLLKPLQDAVQRDFVSGNCTQSSAVDLLKMIPSLLHLAIRLCPRSTPVQQSASVPWLEAVFTALLDCGQEPSASQIGGRQPAPATWSLLTDLLQVLVERDVQLSNAFLEAILVNRSGLYGLQSGSYPLRLPVVAALLEINGAIFLKERNGEEQAMFDATGIQQPKYVDALMASLSELTWSYQIEELPQTISTGSPTEVPTQFGSHQLLIPLLKAYVSGRKLDMFPSLWFWEIRRSWELIGTAGEANNPWLSKELLHSFQSVFETTLLSQRIGSLLVEYILPIRQLIDELGKRGHVTAVDWSQLAAMPATCASIVILEALILSTNKEEIYQANPLAWKALSEDLPKILQYDLRNFPAASRVWSLLQRIHTLSYWVDGKQAFSARQAQLLQSNTFQAAVDQAEFSDPALSYVLTVLGFELDRSLFESAQPFVRKTMEHLEVIRSSPSNSDTKDDSAYIAYWLTLHTMATSITRFPALFGLMSRQERQHFFKALLIFTSHPSGWDQNLCRPTLDALVETAIADTKDTIFDLVHTIVNILQEQSQDSTVGIRSLGIDILLAVPPALIVRAEREKIIDCISSGPFNEIPTSGIGLLDFSKLALMARLMTQQCPTAKICIYSGDAISLVQRLDAIVHQADESHRIDTDSLITIDAIFGLLLKQALIESTEERRRAYLSGLIAISKDLVKNTKKSAVYSLFVKELLVLTLGQVNQHTFKSGEAIIENDFSKFAARVQNIEDCDLPMLRWARLKTIRDVLATRFSTNVRIFSVVEEAAQSIMMSSDPDQNEQALILEIRTLIGASKLLEDSRFHTLPAQDRVRLLKAFEQRLRVLNIHQKVDLVTAAIHGNEKTNLQFVQLVLHTVSQKDVAEAPDFSKSVLPRLCDLAATSTDIGRFGAATASMLYILKERSFLATQHGIDVLVGALTTLSSSRAPALPVGEAAFIYTRLCQLSTALILLHRRRLGGRMHLVVALIQNLLACLFTPHRYSTAAIVARPDWLKPTSSGSGNDATRMLTTEHAVAFSRLLTTLCQPTVSSAVSHRGYHMASESLVSETARAKEYAGQYVGYVLLQYCTLQLQGSAIGDGPDMGDKLKQGIWAVMEIVNIEAMRGMNAGMSKEERVIWSDLYAEWQRVGRSRPG